MMKLYALPALLMLACCSLEAAVITVTTSDDVVAEDGQCSLREAIINANHADQSGSVDCIAGEFEGNVIQFDNTLTGSTITFDGEPMQIAVRNLSIEGPMPGHPGGLVLDGNQASRVIQIYGPGKHVEVTLRDLTVAGGRTADISSPGGGLHVQSVSLTLDRVTVTNNSTGGNSSAGGGISGLMASIELIDSLIEGNHTEGVSSYGGGIYVRQSDISLVRTRVLDNHVHGSNANGGGIWVGPFGSNPSNLELTDSQVAGNSTQHTTTFGGGIWAEADDTIITSSTIANNTAATGAGGVSVKSETFTMINSTVSGNVGSAAGGGMQIRNVDATLIHSTVAFNWAGGNNARDIFLFGTSSEPATLELINSLVVQEDPERRTCSANAFATITTSATLSTHDSCTGEATSADDIGLRILADNGGQTMTHGLSPDSIAVNSAGDCVNDIGVSTDQRGTPRPANASTACDIGAFEVQNNEPVTDLSIAKSVSPEVASIGGTVVFTLEASNLGPDPALGVRVADELPDGYNFVWGSASNGSYDEITGLWEIDHLPIGESATLSIEATVNDGNDHLNSATIIGGQIDPDLDNNSDQAEVTPLQVEDSVFASRFEQENS